MSVLLALLLYLLHLVPSYCFPLKYLVSGEFAETSEANTAVITGPNGNLYPKSGGPEGILTPDSLLAKVFCPL